MANITDYLRWRGDLTLELDPFNEVDNLVMCKPVALNFTDIVPEDGEIPVAEALEKYIALRGEDDSNLGPLVAAGTVEMLKVLVGTKRFGDVRFADYINHIDWAAEEQFSALTLILPNGERFVSFRGTDDTIIAWRENFNMSVSEAVPAQTDAENYLQREGWLFPGCLRVGGHSKGGNLAVYAAMEAPPELQKRILGVYNNDGPGFRESVRGTPEYERIRPVVTTLVPQYSMVGMLMCHEEEYSIVRSSETGISAHNGYTWEVEGPRFVRCEERALRSRIFSRAIQSWAADLDPETRSRTVDAIFDALTSTGAKTLSELSAHKLRQAAGIAGNLLDDPSDRATLSEAVELLILEYADSARQSITLPKISIPKLRRKKDGDVWDSDGEDDEKNKDDG